MTEDTSEFRIQKQKVQLYKKNPFFAYLILYLKFKEVKKGVLEYDTMAVDKEGNVFYVDEFVKSLNDDELMGVITHELSHIVFLHLTRVGSREKDRWNTATDLIINTLLRANNFILPKDCVIADFNNEFDCGKKKIKNVLEKTAEELYSELPAVKNKNGYYIVQIGNGDKQDKSLGKGFDNHINGKDENENGGGKSSGDEELEKKWLDLIEQAVEIAKMKGNLPTGLDRLVGKLHEEKIDWRTILNQFITNQIPYDDTWAKSSKKSVACGIYMPSQVKEKIDICLMVDLSGSIGQEEYTDFISELIGIARAYSDRISMRVFSHDTECYDCGLIENGNTEKIKNLKLKGGGGTSFTEPIKYLIENNINPKCLLWFTDGYGDKVEKQLFPILWVLSKNSSDDLIKDSGEVIKLGEY
jgi:predicted metal-dependent peptidase